MNKAIVKLEFVNCSIPSVLETVVLLPNRFAEQITSYNYSSSFDWNDDVGYAVMNSPTREKFIEALQAEQMRIYKLIADDKIDPESHDVDYAFAAVFED